MAGVFILSLLLSLHALFSSAETHVRVLANGEGVVDEKAAAEAMSPSSSEASDASLIRRKARQDASAVLAEAKKITRVLNRTHRKGRQQVTADATIIDITEDAEVAKTSGEQRGLLKQLVQKGKQHKIHRKPSPKVRTGVQSKKPHQATPAPLSSPTTERRESAAVVGLKNADASQASSIIRKTQNMLHLAEKHLQAPVAVAPPAAPVPPSEEVYSLMDLLVGMFAFIGLLFCMGTVVHFFFLDPTREQRQQQPNRRESVAPRLKALNEGRRASIEQGERTDLSTLRYNLKTAGVDVTFQDSSRGLIDLHTEVQAGNCEVLWVNDPEGGRRLIRLVRLFRGLITVHSEDRGDSVLTEETRTFRNKSNGHAETETINKPITLKMRLDVADALDAGKVLMAQRLHIPRSWQKKYMKVVDPAGFQYVEEDVSVHYRGLITWYLIDEWNFNINLKDIPEEDQDILGFPDDQTFTTTDTTAQEEIIYSWKWQPHDARSQSYWSKSETQRMRRDISLSVDDFTMARTVGEVTSDAVENRPSRGRYSIKAARTSRHEDSLQTGNSRRSVGRSASQSGRSMSRSRT